jgi:hypothetical protein
MSKFLLGRLCVASIATAAAIAHAAGPIDVCNNAPLKYAAPSIVNLNYDGGGTLGTRSKAQADAIVTAAASRWTNVTTATITLGRGADLPLDVTALNYTTYFNGPGTSTDGLNPVIYDTDGSIIDALLGTGQKSSVLGFAGSAYFLAPACRYAEGRAVINGFINVSDGIMTTVIAHELGHLIGLDHTQLDATQGLVASNYPLMYPIANRTLTTLHDDDLSSVSALYPGPTVSTTYGTLNGNFRLADGVTPVRGANIWARDSSVTGRVISSVSDYLAQNNGAFNMLLPPGTYTLNAEAIDTQFDGGSSVGQYADDPAGLSFQPPLYVGGVPMTAKTLGNATPTQITITAGCTATANFRIDGTGSVTGNCAAVTPPSPAANPPRLANISTRGLVGTGNNVLIGGFVIGGSTSKTVAIVGQGPSLAAAGVTNSLANPTLQLIRSSDNAVIATNDNWASAANASAIQAAGFAPSNPLESAVLMTLAPGAYTTILSGVGGGTGTGIIAVYEVDHPEIPLINIATRGQVLTGNDVMIGGFVIQGSGPQTVVVTGTGPSLAAAGIPNPLQNPTLTLVRSSDGATIGTNDNWQSASNAAQIQAAGFAPSNPLESAIMMSLQPGAYTVLMSGAGGGVGIGIIAVYAQ